MATREELRKAKALREARREWYQRHFRITKAAAHKIARSGRYPTQFMGLPEHELQILFGLTEREAEDVASGIRVWIYRSLRAYSFPEEPTS